MAIDMVVSMTALGHFFNYFCSTHIHIDMVFALGFSTSFVLLTIFGYFDALKYQRIIQS
jgi:hypothetical protein